MANLFFRSNTPRPDSEVLRSRGAGKMTWDESCVYGNPVSCTDRVGRSAICLGSRSGWKGHFFSPEVHP